MHIIYNVEKQDVWSIMLGVITLCDHYRQESQLNIYGIKCKWYIIHWKMVRLANELIPKQDSSNKAFGEDKNSNKLALCHRLVDGVVQSTSRAEAKATASISTSSNTTRNHQKNAVGTEQESMLGQVVWTVQHRRIWGLCWNCICNVCRGSLSLHSASRQFTD